MVSDDPSVTFAARSPDAAAAVMDDLCAVYADAYGVPVADEKAGAFRQRLTRSLERQGWSLATASIAEDLVGFAFGYPLERGNTTWWEGLTPLPSAGFTTETGSRTFVIAEIGIRRALQGRKIGRSLQEFLLRDRSEERATLASNPGAHETHDIYGSWGWRSVGTVPGGSSEYFDLYELFVRSLG